MEAHVPQGTGAHRVTAEKARGIVKAARKEHFGTAHDRGFADALLRVVAASVADDLQRRRQHGKRADKQQQVCCRLAYVMILAAIGRL
jgi:hypothetical protein